MFYQNNNYEVLFNIHDVRGIKLVYLTHAIRVLSFGVLGLRFWILGKSLTLKQPRVSLNPRPKRLGPVSGKFWYVLQHHAIPYDI